MNERNLSPEEIARSQDRFAKELLANGAKLVEDPGSDKLRIELTDSIDAPNDEKGNKMGGQLEDAQTVNDMISSNRERSQELTANDFISWMQTNPYKALSFIVEQYGSLEEFQRRATMRAEYRTEQMKQDTDHPDISKRDQAA